MEATQDLSRTDPFGNTSVSTCMSVNQRELLFWPFYTHYSTFLHKPNSFIHDQLEVAPFFRNRVRSSVAKGNLVSLTQFLLGKCVLMVTYLFVSFCLFASDLPVYTRSFLERKWLSGLRFFFVFFFNFSNRGPALALFHQHVPWLSSLSSTFPASFEPLLSAPLPEAQPAS